MFRFDARNAAFVPWGQECSPSFIHSEAMGTVLEPQSLLWLPVPCQTPGVTDSLWCGSVLTLPGLGLWGGFFPSSQFIVPVFNTEPF